MSSAGHAMASVAAQPPPAKGKTKKKKKKGKAPPFETYQVVTLPESGGPPSVIRAVNGFDVLLMDKNIHASSNSGVKELYDFSRHPGNQRYRKFVSLSQTHFDAMSNRKRAVGGATNSNGTDMEDSKQLELAQNVVKTIREQWGGLFLRRFHPTYVNGTQWIEVGFNDSVREVMEFFRQKKQAAEQKKITPFPRIKTEIKSEPTETYHQPQGAENNRRSAQQHQQQPAGAQTPGTVAGLRIIDQAQAKRAIFAARASTQTPQGKRNANGTMAGTPSLGLTPQLPPLPASVSPGMAFVKQLQLPTTPAMPPLVGFGPDRTSMTPLCPDFPALPGAANPSTQNPAPTKPAEPEATTVLPAAAPKPPPQPQPPTETATVAASSTTTVTDTSTEQPPAEVPAKRKRGRPRKGEVRPPKFIGPKRKRGRPRKYPAQDKPPRKPAPKPPGPAHTQIVGAEKDRRGRHRFVPLPDPRRAPTVAPPPPSPGRVQSKGKGGPFQLSPAGKNGSSFQFNLDRSPDLVFGDSPRPRQGSVTYLSPPRPQTPLPYPSPPRKDEQDNSQVEQAKAFLRVKDPMWLSNFTKLSSCRVSMYCHGHMHKWVAGNIRHTVKKNSLRGDDTPLNSWVAEQQAMYRDYCAWEEGRYRSKDRSRHGSKQQPQQEQKSAESSQQRPAQPQVQTTQQQRSETASAAAATQDVAASAPTEASNKAAPAKANTTDPVQTEQSSTTEQTTSTNQETQVDDAPAKNSEDPPEESNAKKGEAEDGDNDSSNASGTKKRPLRSRIERRRTRQRLPCCNKKERMTDSADTKVCAGIDESEPKEDSGTTPKTSDKEAASGTPKEQDQSSSGNTAAVADETVETSMDRGGPPKEQDQSASGDTAAAAKETTETAIDLGGPVPPLQPMGPEATVKDGDSNSSGRNEDQADPKAPKEQDETFPSLQQNQAQEGDLNNIELPELPALDSATIPDGGHAKATSGETLWVLPELDSIPAPPQPVAPPIDEAEEERRMLKQREIQRAKIMLLDSLHFVWQPDQEPPADASKEWKESFYDLREYVRCRGDTAVSDCVELGAWAQLQRMRYQRSMAMLTRRSENVLDGNAKSKTPPLTRGQMAALRGLGFDWDDLESCQFYVMYLKLIEFKSRVGDCLVPPPASEFVMEREDDGEGDDVIVETRADPRLFFWVQRQRFEYVRFLRAKEIAESRAAGVDEDGHVLVQRLLEEEENSVDQEAKRRKMMGDEDNDESTVVADLVGTPAKATLDGLYDTNPHNDVLYTLAYQGLEGENEQNVEQPARRKRKKYTKRSKDALARAKEKVDAATLQSSEGVSTLTQAQVDLLNSAGFIWSTDISSSWILQYRRLHAFYIKNGHAKVTRTTNEAKTKLNRWCTNLRQLHQRNLKGSRFGLTQEKYDLLKKLDFKFEFEDLPERYTFEERFQWLLDFKAAEGHVNVPQRHPTLGHFVKRLRKEHEAHVKGIKLMNTDKLNRLNEIGFVWRVRNHRGTRRPNRPKKHHNDDEDEGDTEDEYEEEIPTDTMTTRIPAISPPKHYSHNIIAAMATRKQASPGSENQCSSCFGTIIFAFAKCQSCQGAYCEECYDEAYQCGDQQCTKCSGTIFPVAASTSI